MREKREEFDEEKRVGEYWRKGIELVWCTEEERNDEKKNRAC